MKEADEERIAARLAKLMAMICVRNTGIEDLHAGTVPVTRTGDYCETLPSAAPHIQTGFPGPNCETR